MSFAATPQLRTAYDLRDAIAANLDERRIPAIVEVGEWDPELLRGQARVMISLEDGTIGEPAGHYQPGAWWPVEGERVARPLLDDAQGYALRIHAPAPSSGPDANAARGAHLATDLLMRATMAALRRQLAAPFRGPARVRWPKKIEGYAAFVRGSLCEVSVVVGSPILDDAMPLLEGDTLIVDSAFVWSDGTTTPPEDVTFPPPP